MKPTPIRIYSLVDWDRGAKARWLLKEIGQPFETRILNRDKKENETPEFLRLNPMGRVPVLELDDRAIFESNAILNVLADRFPEKRMAPPVNTPERMLYEQWMWFAMSMLDVAQTRIMVIEDIPAGELYTKKFTALASDLHDAFEALDVTLAKNSFLVGNRFSAADICVGYHLFWLTLWPELESIMKKFPRVTTYLDRLRAMPSAIEAKVFTYQG